MSKTYKAGTKYRTSIPRSRRLRDAVGASVSSSSAKTVDSGDYVTLSTEQIITAVKTFAAGLNITGGSSNNTLYIDENGALHCKLPIISDSYMSAYGAASAAEGGSGVTLAEVWASLTGHADDYAASIIDAAHLDLSGYATSAALALKQDALNFDSAPTQNSTNPVTSHGIYAALAAKQDLLTEGTGISIENGVISVTGGLGGVTSVNGLTGDVTIDTDFIPLDGSSVIDGSLSPNYNAEYDLGSSSYKWRYIYGTYLLMDSLAVFRGGVAISGGSSVNSTFYMSGGKLHCYPEIVFDNNSFFDGSSLAAVATSGSYDDLSNTPDLSVYATTASLGSAAYSNIGAFATSSQGTKADSALQTVKLNGTALTKTSNAVNVNACTSVTVPAGLSVAALTSAGVIAISLENGYTIPETSDIQAIADNGAAITALQAKFSGNSAKTALKLTTDAGNSTTPVYFSNGIPVACSLDMSAYATSAQGAKADSALQTVKLNGTALTKTSNAVNVNACTSVTVPTGLSVAALTSAGVIAISLANGYSIPTTGNVTQITTNANAISTLQGYFTSGVAKNAAKLNCGDVGSASLPVYFDDGVPKACTLNLSNYVDLTSAQSIAGVKTFVNGLDITGGVSDRTIYKDSNNCLHVTIPIVCDSFISAYGAGSSANVIDEMWTALAASGTSHKIHADHLPYDIPPEFVAGVDDDYTGESYADVETMMIAVFERLYNLESALGL